MSHVICDKSRCIGCLTCVVSCMDHHYDAAAADAVSPRLYRKETLPSGLMQYFTDSCRHCPGAPCVKTCPTGALSRGADGLVTADRSLCVGCRACARSCPFQIPRYDSAGKMVKCDGCGGGEPACVRSCPRGALSVQA